MSESDGPDGAANRAAYQHAICRMLRQIQNIENLKRIYRYIAAIYLRK